MHESAESADAILEGEEEALASLLRVPAWKVAMVAGRRGESPLDGPRPHGASLRRGG
jgi:hypothetical protein